ncbi:MAG: hypothetical protein LRY76_06785 [Alphaproteobacteria bacterium]|nr:hypothetical protein [Alphaproteobacteria bacterium]
MITQIYSYEYIRDIKFIEIYHDGTLVSKSNYQLDEDGRTITFDYQIPNGAEILLLHDINAEFHYEADTLFVHSVAFGSKQVETIPNNAKLIVNGNSIDFTRPDGQDLVLDYRVGIHSIISNMAMDFQQTFTDTGILFLNGHQINVDTSDTPETFISKINGLGISTRASYTNKKIVLKNDGENITLSGDWDKWGFVSGLYASVVSIMQHALGDDYRVLSLDGQLKIINREGSPLNIVSPGWPNLIQVFGLATNTTINNQKITVVTMDSNSGAFIRTEVFQGNTIGEYPITKQGFSGYSTNISVIGNDSIIFSDFEMKTVDMGYSFYRYDEEPYDYSEYPGISFKKRL